MHQVSCLSVCQNATMKVISLTILTWCMFQFCESSHFRGGSISWKPTENLYEAEFAYRLGWRYGSGHGCNETLINQYVNRTRSSWICTSGCSSSITVSNHGYICLAASQAEQWELGEFSFKYKFSSSGPFTITYSSYAWISLDYGTGGGQWSIETIVDFGIRSDTGRPNHNPTITGKPTYTVMYGCTEDLKIPVLDQDGDNVRCRWAIGTSECGSVCNGIPNTILNETTCTLTITANHKAGGIYAVAIIAEDYPKSTVSIGGRTYTPNDTISKAPFQFLVETPSDSSKSCSDKPVFVSPSPPTTKVVVIHQGQQTILKFYATSKGTTISSFLTIAPPGVSQSSVRPDPYWPGIFYVDVIWTPTMNDVGNKTICLEATDAYGIATELYCVTVNVIDVDECASDPCLNGATCNDLIYEYFCVCADGFTGANCEIDIDECASNPCLNAATCIDQIDGYSCVCVDGFTGVKYIDECVSDPCLNAATCIDIINEYSCVCVDGFTGVNCETDIDECASVCCLNGGTCIDTIGAAICVCPPSVTGEICQTDYCQSQPCQNGGLCVYNSTTGYECECVDGWRGIHCSYRHENETFMSNQDLYTTDYMHYSSCNCFFGNGKQQLCDKNKTSVGYGVLGAILGILTVVVLYIIVDGCLHKQLCCFKEKIIVEDQNKKSKEDNEKTTLDEHDNDIPIIEEPDTAKKPDHVSGHRHRKCWACEVKYNKIPPPAPWMIH